MQSVGQTLFKSRVAQGLTIEQVNSSTRIPLVHLRAIEADNLTQFSSAFFYKSFVKQFAEYLHLHYAELAPAVQAAADSMPQPRVPGEGEAGAPKVTPLPVLRRANHRWLYSLISLVVALSACSAVYAKWQSARFSLRELWNTAVNVSQSAEREVSAKLAPSAALATTAETGSATPGSAIGDTGSKESFTLEVSATEPTWLSIFADGKRSFTGTLDTAETKTLEGHESARIRTGNAGGVSVVFNGRVLGALGPRGQIRTVVFTKDRYEVLDEPAHVAMTGFIPTVLPVPLQAQLKPPPLF